MPQQDSEGDKSAPSRRCYPGWCPFAGDTIATSARWSRERTLFTFAINVSNAVGSLLTTHPEVPRNRCHGRLRQKKNRGGVVAVCNG
jgi:hypothetical protein